MGPNRSNKQEAHQVIVQEAGYPVDLALLRNLNQLFDTARESNEQLEELQAVKQVLSIALHEQCSANATFIYNRCFFAAASDYTHGEWNLGDGKALWRGFYSCLVFAKDKYQLMMNLDGRYAISAIHRFSCLVYCSEIFRIHEEAAIPRLRW